MVIWSLPAENDQYGPRLLQIILLTFCILMKKAPVSFSGERTIVLSGEHSPQGKARNLLYKTMGGWFYSIPAIEVSGRKEATKAAVKVCSVILLQKS